MDILVVCHSLMMSGGLMRFERFGHEAVRMGHRLSYLSFAGGKAQFDTAFDQLDMAQAEARTWDVTMVPGQGFPQETIRQFDKLQAPGFGRRMQHVLNDRTFKDGFKLVNSCLKPDTVVFNNRHWDEAEMQEFSGRVRTILEGAVDTRFYAPAVKDRRAKKKYIIGAQAKREPVTDLLKMLDTLPEQVNLHFFNKVHEIPEAFAHLQSAGRVRFLGKLNEEQLRDFYHDCDCIIHNEKFAGWANIVAEAMACGVPVICTKPGTLAIAGHKETALVLEKADEASLTAAVRFLGKHPGQAHAMANRARHHICDFDWRDYSQKLIQLCQPSQ